MTIPAHSRCSCVRMFPLSLARSGEHVIVELLAAFVDLLKSEPYALRHRKALYNTGVTKDQFDIKLGETLGAGESVTVDWMMAR